MSCLFRAIHAFAGMLRIEDKYIKICSSSTTDTIAPGAHRHAHWEAKLLLRGSCRWRGGEQACMPRMLLFPPDVVHFSHRREDMSNHAIILVLGENGGWNIHQRRVSNDLRPAIGHCGEGLIARIGSPVDVIWNQLKNDMPNLRHDTLLANFWVERLRFLIAAYQLFISDHALSPWNDTARLIERARQYIDTHYHRSDLTVVEVAEVAGCCSTYLATIMRKATGQTVRQILIQTRLERACAMLKEGQYSIKEVAFLTGWQNAFYFSNSFFRHYGLRPSEWLCS